MKSTEREKIPPPPNPSFLTPLSLFLILLFTNTSNRFSSYYFPSSKDFEPTQSQCIPSPPISNPKPSPSPSHVSYEQSPEGELEGEGGEEFEFRWEICREGKGVEVVDYIPSPDNVKAIKELKSRRHMEHRERHCPKPSPTCLVPLPKGYKVPVPWPKSRDMVRLMLQRAKSLFSH